MYMLLLCPCILLWGYTHSELPRVPLELNLSSKPQEGLWVPDRGCFRNDTDCSPHGPGHWGDEDLRKHLGDSWLVFLASSSHCCTPAWAGGGCSGKHSCPSPTMETQWGPFLRDLHICLVFPSSEWTDFESSLRWLLILASIRIRCQALAELPWPGCISHNNRQL